ncbi:alpha-2-macroglobulin-like [Arapaima gigas]
MFGFFIVFLLLQQTADTETIKKSIYLVTVTSKTESGNTETLCAHILPKESVTFTIVLKVSGQEDQVLLNKVVTEDFHRCVSFQVPIVFTPTTATINAHMVSAVQGGTETLEKTTKILINPRTNVVIIQTDKPIYKPGQTVMFRIVTLDSSFLPLNRMFSLCPFSPVQDPSNNRIAQWLNQSSVSGILDFSHPMTPEAMQGNYSINAWDENWKMSSYSFRIEGYVLPKYEVKIHLPDVVSVQDTQIKLKVCGKYTYGKPVLGSAKADVCLKSIWFIPFTPEFGCITVRMSMDKTGCATETIDLTPIKLKENSLIREITVHCEVQEQETGEIIQQSADMPIVSNVITLSFEDSVSTFRPGIPYEIKVVAVKRANSPLPNAPVFLLMNQGAMCDNWQLTTDSKGVARISLNTSSWRTELVNFEAHYKEYMAPSDHFAYHLHGSEPTPFPAHLSVTKFYSKSKSFVKIMQVDGQLPCDQEGLLKVQYIIQGTAQQNSQELLTFSYMVLSRGTAVQHGHLQIAVKKDKVNTGEFTVQLQQTRRMAPYAQVVVYTVLPSAEIVADSYTLPIQKCLRNKVSLKFSALQELPGEKTSLELTADPGSLCSLRAVDQSVFLMAPQQQLTVDSVFGNLPFEKLHGYPYSVEEPEYSPCNLSPWERNRNFGPPQPVSSGAVPNSPNEIYSIFKEIGIKILTNTDVRKHVICTAPFSFGSSVAGQVQGLTDSVETVQGPMGPVFPMKAMEPAPSFTVQQSLPPLETVRTYFPETWIWDLVPVTDSGSVKVEHTVPDTITKWVAEAFCTSPTGFGVAPNADLTAFQPFFVSLTLPYSVIRGEIFALKATVFNYLPNCIMVQVNLDESAQYTAQPCEGCQYSQCLCSEESKTFKWILKPTDLGKVSVKVRAEALRTDELCGNELVTVPERGRTDTVVRKLLVEAEGTKQTVTHNALVCPADSQMEKVFSLKLPKVYINGSVKAFLSVLGDLMGRSMRNLDSLLTMPYGCGEQNMVLFAPNIYILKYLESTKQLTKEIKAKATQFLESGYQRELNYKHHDGSYSAFGKNDQSGNTWLTAFVLKSFEGARPYIFVDPKHIIEAKAWLAKHQHINGCFMAVGKLFNNRMKGGVSDEISLTAYITAALLELAKNSFDQIIIRGLNCLRNAFHQLKNLYTTALLSYTFTLAGDHEMRHKLITILANNTITTGGAFHWEHSDASRKKTDSLEVEMTSYVLLALLSGPQLPGFGLDYASKIVHWLVEQQNAYGGFSSTQDTVVALQALALYGAATYNPNGDTIVNVTSGGGYKHEFTVSQHNRLLYQEERLKEVPGNYSIKAEGKSCAFLQIALHYNVPVPKDFSAFNITAKADGPCNSTRNALTVTVLFCLYRYNGRREETNMAIINIKLLSGYLVDKNSLRSMLSQPGVKRTEEDKGHVLIYIEDLKRMLPSTYYLSLIEDVPVKNRKPALVKVYDYYQTSDEAVTEYRSPCADGELNEL